tara:strand:- start:115 stop:1125 length:1011 start_codon:yes stop_codon:yes gene_type:complete
MVFNNSGKNIFITGANSGIGFYALINLLKNKNFLCVPIRSKTRKDLFLKNLKKIFDEIYLQKYLTIIENIDLDDLENIDKLGDYLRNKNVLFDIFILNAGLQYTGGLYPKVSKQGIELTFAVNHLSHFYLINILYSLIKDGSESRIIITSSDVHNPKSSGGNIGKKAGLNNLNDFKEKIMGDFKNFNADKSYKDSKLCNILFARELSNRIKLKNKKISILTWAPGLVFPIDDLGFFRYSSKFNKFGYLVFSKIANNILGISESVQNAGYLLSEIAMESKYNNLENMHLSNQLISFRKHKLVFENVSEEASKPELALKLWELSKELCESFGQTSLDL